jgi:hypothetical protein
MRDRSDGPCARRVLMAEALGLALARKAAGILAKHRDMLTDATSSALVDSPEFGADNAVFTAVLDAANECLARFDDRPAEQRWCDALLQLLELAGPEPG